VVSIQLNFVDDSLNNSPELMKHKGWPVGEGDSEQI